ncbi:MAG: hypothetical protein CTY30_00885 [Methylocystis sp.]|nr:MAG: hypothetical protein CTY30_00885 [Methylocystis sp.]
MNMVAKRIAQDNPALIALGTALVGGAVEAGTSIARAATGPGSPLSVDSEDGDGVALFVRWAQENLSPDEMRALGDALRDAADNADNNDSGRHAQDSAWRTSKPDSFLRRYPGACRIRQGW